MQERILEGVLISSPHVLLTPHKAILETGSNSLPKIPIKIAYPQPTEIQCLLGALTETYNNPFTIDLKIHFNPIHQHQADLRALIVQVHLDLLRHALIQEGTINFAS
jgi:hypothetical protein